MMKSDHDEYSLSLFLVLTVASSFFRVIVASFLGTSVPRLVLLLKSLDALFSLKRASMSWVKSICAIMVGQRFQNHTCTVKFSVYIR